MLQLSVPSISRQYIRLLYWQTHVQHIRHTWAMIQSLSQKPVIKMTFLSYGGAIGPTRCIIPKIEVLGDKSTLYIRVTLYWGYLIVLWLFHWVCILYCGCLNWFCDVWGCVCWCVYVWVCVCVGFVMCECFGNMCTCIYCVFVLFHLSIFILTFSVCTNVSTTATEWQLKCSK